MDAYLRVKREILSPLGRRVIPGQVILRGTAEQVFDGFIAQATHSFEIQRYTETNSLGSSEEEANIRLLSINALQLGDIHLDDWRLQLVYTYALPETVAQAAVLPLQQLRQNLLEAAAIKEITDEAIRTFAARVQLLLGTMLQTLEPYMVGSDTMKVARTHAAGFTTTATSYVFLVLTNIARLPSRKSVRVTTAATSWRTASKRLGVFLDRYLTTPQEYETWYMRDRVIAVTHLPPRATATATLNEYLGVILVQRILLFSELILGADPAARPELEGLVALARDRQRSGRGRPCGLSIPPPTEPAA